MIESEKASDTLGLAFSHDRGGRIQRDVQCEHLAAKTLVEREVATDRDDLVVGMRGHDQYTLLLDRTKLARHAVRDAMNTAEEMRRRPLKDAV
jgi:hypothetical protein